MSTTRRKAAGRGDVQPAVRRLGKNYRIPALWDCWGYAGPKKRLGGEVVVEPCDYFRECIAWIARRSETGAGHAGESLAQICRQKGAPLAGMQRRAGRGGDWIRGQLLYGTMIRATTAWDHDGDGRLTSRHGQELGTFIKSILLMPLLERMGVSVLYLLPVVKVSRLYRKGELGCPYAARNFFELDPDLHDPIYSDDPADVTNEFALFCEAAHHLGMRVMLDLAPRTVARDNDWILEHPEWFYWIDRRRAKTYGAPRPPQVHYSNPIPGRLGDIYKSPDVPAHLSAFRFAPNIADPARWAKFVAAARRRPPRDLVADIGRHFGVITPPGFSDVINDPQPPWSDVTYFRLYRDLHDEARQYLPNPKAQPPYVLFDTIKCDRFPAKRPHRELWNRLANILPFYQQFGIDGARIDMAHALPADLERMILDRPRRRDPDFAYLAENLSVDRHVELHRAGYNMVIGSCWWMQPRSHEGQMHKLLKELPGLKIPIMAAAEAPDTPRATVRHGGRKFARQSIVVDCFLPNGVPMIHSGIEVFERQPVNLGLDVGPPGRFALPTSDPFAGKLAFFDRYALHWKNAGGKGMVEMIGRVASIRERFIAALADPKAYFAPVMKTGGRHVLATGFHVRESGGNDPKKPGRLREHRGRRQLLMIANFDFKRSHTAKIGGLAAGATVETLFELEPSPLPRFSRGTLTVTLKPGDAKVLLI